MYHADVLLMDQRSHWDGSEIEFLCAKFYQIVGKLGSSQFQKAVYLVPAAEFHVFLINKYIITNVSMDI